MQHRGGDRGTGERITVARLLCERRPITRFVATTESSETRGGRRVRNRKQTTGSCYEAILQRL